MAETISVLVADDHAVVRAGIAQILGAEPDIKIIGEASDGLEAVNKAVQLNPDVILMDVFMPRFSGLEATAAIKDKVPGAKVLVFTISERDEDLFQALRYGAHGYLLKSATINEVADAVRRTAAGEAMLSPNIASRLVEEFRSKTNEPRLSPRELEVLQLLSQGLGNAEIAQKLFLGESTVRTYLSRLLDKLHLRNRAEAIAYATRHLDQKPF